MRDGVIRAVLFDLDGTLLDTAPDLVGALNHVRESEGLPPVDTRDFRQYVSQGALGLIREGLPQSDEQVREQRRTLFLDHYARNLHSGTRPFDGVEDLLAVLESRAIPWGVVTNKPEFLTHPLIAAIGWRQRAGCVICGDTLPRRKPDPAPVLLGCELLGVEPSAAVMVGDDPRDLEASEAAGTMTALAAYGYGAADIIASGRTVQFLIDKPQDLLALDGLGRASTSR